MSFHHSMSNDPIPDSPEAMARHLRAIYASTSWRITAPLRWLGNALPALRRAWRHDQPAALRAPVINTGAPEQVLDHRADFIPPRWPGLPPPAVLWRAQLDAAIQRAEADRCN